MATAARFEPAPLAEAATPASWTDTASARLAIAACLDADPHSTTKFETFAQTRDEWREYEGPLADAVNAAREAWLIEQGGGEGTVRYMRLHFEVPSVTQAIDDAVLSVERVVVAIRQPDERLLALLTAERELSAAEWAYLDAVDAAAGGRGL